MPAAAKTTAKKTTAKKKETNVLEMVIPTIKKTAAAKKDDKKSEAIVDRLQELLSKSLDEMLEHFDELTLTKKCEIVRDYLPYVTPKMAQTEVNTNQIDPLKTQLGKLAHSVTDEDE